ncbi:MAG TPA: hypothetical protein VD737_08175 [Steroidobacteraceae bacterium]|nr:hypothetical protein [Steroidobacteraceae bacterium]
MSSPGKTSQDSRKTRSRKPPPRWRRYLVQAELELPPPSSHASTGVRTPTGDDAPEGDPDAPPWYQTRFAVLALAASCLALAVVTSIALWNGARDRETANAAEALARALTLRAVNSERTLRIAPNPRSWSATPDASIAWPEPPQLLELHLPVAYARYAAYALVVDKVDQGRVMVIERMTADSNRDLRLAVNSSAFGPGEYRLRVQGYTWKGQRVDVGWVRLVVR